MTGLIIVRAYKVVDGNISLGGKILEKYKEGQQPFGLTNGEIYKYLKIKYFNIKTKDRHPLAYKAYIWGGINARALFPVDENGVKLKLVPFGILDDRNFTIAKSRLQQKGKFKYYRDEVTEKLKANEYIKQINKK